MLQGEALPVDMFKRFIVPRLARLVYENRPDDYRRSMHYAELWVEYMQALNREDLILETAVFEEFHDPYMQGPAGQGIFLAGVLLGYMAERQVGPEDIGKSPLFKQIQFGRMDK